MNARACPICRRAATDANYAPFCSKRCSHVDLQRWFSGAYAVPAAAEEPDDDAVEASEGAGQGRGPHL